MRSIIGVAASTVLVLAGCQRTAPPPPVGGAQAALQAWLLPTAPGAGEAALAATSDGRLMLSWIDSVPGRRNALQFSAWTADGQWQSAPRTIAVGDSLLTDPRNRPQIVATSDGALWVHWLQRSPEPTDTGPVVDLQLARSADGGFNWSAPVRVLETPPGAGPFAVAWPHTPQAIGLAWIDAAPVAASTGSPGPAAVDALHTAVFDRNLGRNAESTVSASSRCQLAVAKTARGAVLVVTRQDAAGTAISAVRRDGTRWAAPVRIAAVVSADTCLDAPPTIAASGNTVVIAWSAPASGVALVGSVDAGTHFGAPVVVDAMPAEGGVATAVDGQQAWVAWVRRQGATRSLWVVRYPSNLSRPLQRTQVAILQGNAAATPRIALQAGRAFVVWNDIADGAPRLRGAILAR